MPKKGHSEEQIIAALRQYESGDKVAAVTHDNDGGTVTLRPLLRARIWIVSEEHWARYL